MLNLIHCQSVTKAFGAQTLFRDIDLTINSGDRIGLIGPNGSGKSTLLKIICGIEDADAGAILAAKHIKVGYLEQADLFADDLTIAENLLSSLADEEIDEVEKHTRVQSILSRAEFGDDNQRVAYLSGGWRKRLAICRSLLASPQVLVMDEPTNHLDIEGIIWLEKLLQADLTNGPEAFIVVSHDRQFLENCTNRIVELSAVYPDGSLQVDGNYTQFIDKRVTYLEQQMQMEERLANKMRRETEWLRRGPKARATKARYRIDEAYRLQDQLTEVKGRNRALSNVRINFDATGRKTKKLLEAQGLSKRYGERVLFEDLDMLLAPGTRLGLLGRNGCGKSTLMQILASSADADATCVDEGEIVTADNVKIVSFDQKRESLDPLATLRRALAPEGDSIVFQERSVHVVTWAKRFLFRPDQLETPVGELSGGEQARILIASLMRQPADILLLDEPTNDLDIGSLDVLEESLTEFAGALVLVSHDRFMLDRVCDSILGFDGKGGVAYFADYEQWLSALASVEGAEEKKIKEKKAGKESGGKKKQKAGKLSYLDQREYEQMEERILMVEEVHDSLLKEIELPETSGDPDKLHECWQKLEKIKAEIETLYDRWNELEEKKSES